MVVVVAYFGSRTNLIILPQASQANFSTCPPLLSSPARRLLSTTCCISQHTETEKCSAMRGISFIGTQQKWGSVVVESKNCKSPA